MKPMIAFCLALLLISTSIVLANSEPVNTDQGPGQGDPFSEFREREILGSYGSQRLVFERRQPARRAIALQSEAIEITPFKKSGVIILSTKESLRLEYGRLPPQGLADPNNAVLEEAPVVPIWIPDAPVAPEAEK